MKIYYFVIVLGLLCSSCATTNQIVEVESLPKLQEYGNNEIFKIRGNRLKVDPLDQADFFITDIRGLYYTHEASLLIQKVDSTYTLFDDKGRYLIESTSSIENLDNEFLGAEIGEKKFICRMQNCFETKVYFDEVRPIMREINDIDETYFLLEDDGKFGIYNRALQNIYKIKYDNIYSNKADRIILTVNEVSQLGDFEGNVFPSKYKSSDINFVPDSELLYVRDSANQIGFIDKNEKIVLPFEYDYADVGYFKNYIIVKKNGKFGFHDKNGQALSQLIYDKVNPKSNYEVEAYIGDSIVYYDKEFNVIDKDKEEEAYKIDRRIFRIKRDSYNLTLKDKKKGVVKNRSIIIFPPEYDVIEHYRHDESHYFLIGNEKGYYVKNLGDTIILDKSDLISKISLGSDLFVYTKDGKEGLFSIDNGVLLEPVYDRIYRNKKNIIVENAGKKGVVNLSGAWLLGLEYEDIKIESDYLFATKNAKIGMYDAEFNLLSDYVYDRMYITGRRPDRSTDFICAHLNGKVGTFDMELDSLIPLEYDEIKIHQYVKEDDYIVKLNGLMGVVSMNGSIIIPIDYRSVSVGKSVYTCLKDSVFYYFDRDAKQLFQSKYRLSDSNWMIRGEVVGPDRFILGSLESRKVGLYSNTGEEILPPEYDRISFMLSPNHVQAWNNKKIGLFSIDGEEVAPIIYNKILHTNIGLCIAQGDGKIVVYSDRGALLADNETEGANSVTLSGDIFKLSIDDKEFSINQKGSCYPRYDICPERTW